MCGSVNSVINAFQVQEVIFITSIILHNIYFTIRHKLTINITFNKYLLL